MWHIKTPNSSSVHHAQHTTEKHQINEAKKSSVQKQQKRVQQGTETKVQAPSEEKYVPATISNYSISNLTYV